jgi:hypothetical protein
MIMHKPFIRSSQQSTAFDCAWFFTKGEAV